jgi:hypothetical protein
VKALFLVLALAGSARAEQMWWSFPEDDESAIEVDAADAHAGDFEELRDLVRVAKRCNVKKGEALMAKRAAGEGTPLREIRIEQKRCVLTLPAARKLFGKRVVERLEDELDAHVSFLQPRKFPTTKN